MKALAGRGTWSATGGEVLSGDDALRPATDHPTEVARAPHDSFSPAPDVDPGQGRPRRKLNVEGRFGS
jgi:hypothetical protein